MNKILIILGIILVLGILVFQIPPIKKNFFPDKCTTWIEGNNEVKSTCPSGDVCVPENKVEFCYSNECRYGGGGFDLAYEHTKEYPAIGVCKTAFTFSD